MVGILKKRRFWLIVSMTLISVYATIWGIGYYRVSQIVQKLRADNQVKRDKVELCLKTVNSGDDPVKLEPFLDVFDEVDDGRIIKFYALYHTSIEETSSAANRITTAVKIEVINGKVYSIGTTGVGLTHADRFMSHWRFYPMVCFQGLRTFEDEN